MKEFKQFLAHCFLTGCLIAGSAVCHSEEFSGETEIFGDDIEDYWAYVAPSYLNVRSGPSMEDDVIGVVNSGDRIQVTHQTNHWVAIKYSDDNTAYVGRKHIVRNIGDIQTFETLATELELTDSQIIAEGGNGRLLSLFSAAAELSTPEVAAVLLINEILSRHGNKVTNLFKKSE